MSNAICIHDNTIDKTAPNDQFEASNKIDVNDKNRHLLSSRMLKLIMGMGLIFAMSAAQAQSEIMQCFSNVQHAYDDLIAQEEADSEALKRSRANVVVNINSATEAELTRLTGIGSSKAQAIIRHRNTFGNFTDIDGLVAVKGIGIITVEKNRARLTVSHYY